MVSRPTIIVKIQQARTYTENSRQCAFPRKPLLTFAHGGIGSDTPGLKNDVSDARRAQAQSIGKGVCAAAVGASDE